MKRTVLITLLAFACIMGYAQSTNPLNYSGRMYVEAIEIIATPRYVSYEDHAILSQQMRIPSVEITKIDMDFEKGIVIAKEVVYVDLVNEGDKAELVWPEFGKPYFQQITKTEDGVKIARMVLSRKPYVADESEALMNLLQGLGTM